MSLHKEVSFETEICQHLASALDLKTELLNAVMGALDAYNSMSTQALTTPKVQHGLKDILLNHSRL